MSSTRKEVEAAYVTLQKAYTQIKSTARTVYEDATLLHTDKACSDAKDAVMFERSMHGLMNKQRARLCSRCHNGLRGFIVGGRHIRDSVDSLELLLEPTEYTDTLKTCVYLYSFVGEILRRPRDWKQLNIQAEELQAACSVVKDYTFYFWKDYQESKIPGRYRADPRCTYGYLAVTNIPGYEEHIIQESSDEFTVLKRGQATLRAVSYTYFLSSGQFLNTFLPGFQHSRKRRVEEMVVAFVDDGVEPLDALLSALALEH